MSILRDFLQGRKDKPKNTMTWTCGTCKHTYDIINIYAEEPFYSRNIQVEYKDRYGFKNYIYLVTIGPKGYCEVTDDPCEACINDAHKAMEQSLKGAK